VVALDVPKSAPGRTVRARELHGGPCQRSVALSVSLAKSEIRLIENLIRRELPLKKFLAFLGFASLLTFAAVALAQASPMNQINPEPVPADLLPH